MMKEALLVIDKEPGPTSFDIVRKVKEALGGVKVGHAGSLDPFASGVLVLLTGKATKLSQALLNADKTYHALIKLGSATDTMDLTGKVIEEGPVPDITNEQIQSVLKSFEGVWHQTPPMYSAKKIHGVRFYELARQNIKVRRAPIPVNLYEIKWLSYSASSISIEVFCSKGTYVRSLADEIGRRLGTLAHLSALRRLSCGDFTLEESVRMDDFICDISGWMAKGYNNYLRLLKSELLQRRTLGNKGLDLQYLQMPPGNGKSF